MTGSRPRTTSELLEHGARHTARLDRGIAALDRGDTEGLHDVVTSLRILTWGSDQLLEALSQNTVPVAFRARLVDPAMADADVEFALGGMPRADVDTEGPEATSLAEFLGTRCLVVGREPERTVYTWGQLIARVANKLGYVHSDRQVPVALDAVGAMGYADTDALAYSIRNVGVVLSRYAHALLHAAGAVTLAPAFRIPAPGRTWIGGSARRAAEGGRTVHSLTFSFADMGPGRRSLASWPAEPLRQESTTDERPTAQGNDGPSRA